MFKTIIVALDCSELGDRVLAALALLEIQQDTKVILAHVLPGPKTDSEVAADRPHPGVALLYEERDRQLQYYQRQLPGSEIALVSGEPAAEIIRLAYLHQADLILIGTRGLRGLQRVIEGSVSSEVVEGSPCSVFVVKPERESVSR